MSYFLHREVAPALLQNMKGEQRRAMARDALRAGRAIDRRFYRQDATPGFVDTMEHFAPRWMGGEYVPDYKEGEVDIARLVLASATEDVYSVRARWVGHGLRYRIVDEYETDWYLTREQSERPLSLREPVELIDHASFSDNDSGDLTDALRDGAPRDGDESAATFVTVTPEVYPELETYYVAKARAWLDRLS